MRVVEKASRRCCGSKKRRYLGEESYTKPYLPHEEDRPYTGGARPSSFVRDVRRQTNIESNVLHWSVMLEMANRQGITNTNDAVLASRLSSCLTVKDWHKEICSAPGEDVLDHIRFERTRLFTEGMEETCLPDSSERKECDHLTCFSSTDGSIGDVRIVEAVTNDVYHVVVRPVPTFPRSEHRLRNLCFEEDVVSNWCGYGIARLVKGGKEEDMFSTFFWRKIPKRTCPPLREGDGYRHFAYVFPESRPDHALSFAREGEGRYDCIDPYSFSLTDSWDTYNLVLNDDFVTNGKCSILIRRVPNIGVSTRGGRLRIWYDGCVSETTVVKAYYQPGTFQKVFDPFFASAFSYWCLFCLQRTLVHRVDVPRPTFTAQFRAICKEVVDDVERDKVINRLLPIDDAARAFNASGIRYLLTNPPFRISKDTVSRDDFTSLFSGSGKRVVILFSQGRESVHTDFFAKKGLRLAKKEPSYHFMVPSSNLFGANVVFRSLSKASVQLAYFCREDRDATQVESKENTELIRRERVGLARRLLRSRSDASTYEAILLLEEEEGNAAQEERAEAKEVARADRKEVVGTESMEESRETRKATEDALYANVVVQYLGYAPMMGDEEALKGFESDVQNEMKENTAGEAHYFYKRLLYLLFRDSPTPDERKSEYQIPTFLKEVETELSKEEVTHMYLVEFYRQLSLNVQSLRTKGLRYYQTKLFYEMHVPYVNAHEYVRLIDVWFSSLTLADEWLRVSAKETVFSDKELGAVTFSVRNERKKRRRLV